MLNNVTELLKAIAGLLWAAFPFVLLLRFHKQLADILGRIRRGKVLGHEFELDNSLRELERAAKAAESETPQLPTSASSPPPQSDTLDSEKQVLHEAARSPKVALMLLASLLERELREVLASTGWGQSGNVQSFRAGVDSLAKLGVLATNLAGSVDHFWSLRNRLVHGHDATDDDILRAIDSGLTILRTLRAIPRETNTVYHPGVELFADPAGNAPMPSVRGVVLQTTSPGGVANTLRVFPTTRTHFKEGKRVAWEWNRDFAVGEAWYRHPDTGQIEPAWGQSMEFIGRHLEDL